MAMQDRERRGFPLPSSKESSPKKPLSNEVDLLNFVGESLQILAEEISHGKSDRLKAYLDFASRFHRYSRSNQWLILSQMPEASQIASYRKWQDLGYQVAKGSRGIRILAPSIRKVPSREDAENAEDADQTDRQEPRRQIVRFVAVSVFDVSQLTPDKRPPEFFIPLEGDADGLYDRLAQAATAEGFHVEEASDTHGAEGYSQGRRIVTRTGLTSVNRFLTAVHEYGHGLLHQGVHQLGERLNDRRGRLTTQVKEAHAEAISYIVARHFGIANPFSADYLLQWGNTPETLRAELDIVLAAASHIITRLEGDPSPVPAEAEELS